MLRYQIVFVLAFTTSAVTYGQIFDSEKEGASLVHIAGCADCHTANANEPMAGGVKLVTDFGNFYTPNITPDPLSGIGNWTFDQFFNAIRFGRMRDGSYYYPVFPYRSYTQMTNRDIRHIYDYLRSLPPIRKRNRPLEIKAPFNQRELLLGWQKLYFKSGPMKPNFDQSASWNRGAYLVEAFAHCTECHTPRNSLGGLETNQWMAGSAFNIPGKIVPNITPDLETGLGTWSRQDWQRFLATGILPDSKTVGGEMAEVIQNTSALSAHDRDDMIEYLQELPPVRHWADGIKK